MINISLFFKDSSHTIIIHMQNPCFDTKHNKAKNFAFTFIAKATEKKKETSVMRLKFIHHISNK